MLTLRWALALALCLAVVPCSAQLIDGFNHDEYHWTVVETEHFRIIHHQGLEHAAEVAAEEAEAVYPKIVAAMGEPDERIDVILSTHTSVGIFGGYTFPLSHRVFLAGLAIYGARGPRDDLLRSILAHELVHAVAHWPCRRGDIGTGWEHTNWRTLPNWFVEGAAEHVSRDEPDALGGDMVRCAILDGEMTSLAAMSARDWDDIDDISLTYRAGQGMVAYLVREYGKGDNAILGRLEEKHSHFPVFDRALEHTVGIGEEELFHGWLAEARDYYQKDAATRHDSREYSARFPVPIEQVFGARWSPDGKRIAVLGYKDCQEYEAQLFIGKTDMSDYYSLALELDELRSSQFSWSPDGRYLVYSGHHRKSAGRVISGIYVHDIDTGERRLITEDRVAMDPAWSPDGQWIAFVSISDNGDEHHLAVMRPDGTDIRVLTGQPGMPEAAGYAPVWSPDGKRIACEVLVDGDPNIALVNEDGSGYEMLTNDTDVNVSPSWFSAGPDHPGRIAFLSGRSDRFDVWSVDLATRTFLKHTDEGIAMVGNPTWTLDGAGITYALTRIRGGTVQTVPYKHVVATLSAEAKATPADGRPGELRRGGYVEGQSSARETEAPLEPAKSVILRRYPYSSTDRFKTTMLRPNFTANTAGFVGGLTWRGSDPLNKNTVAVQTGYNQWLRQPTVEAVYANNQNRVSWQASAFSRTPEAVRRGGLRMLGQGLGADVRARYIRAVGSSSYRRDVVETGVHTERARLFGNAPSAYVRQGMLTFAEAQWTRTKDMPGRGDWLFQATARQSIPGLSAYPLQEFRGLAQWNYESSAGRQRLTVQLEGRVGRASSWAGQPITGASIEPTVSYTFRIADDALPGLWPCLYLDRIEGRVVYTYTRNFGTPLYQADGHGLGAEIENRGFITKILPYRLVVGAEIDTRAPTLAPRPYVLFDLNLAQF